MTGGIDSRLRTDLVMAGSAALLLCFAQRNPNMWWVSFFALVPYLYRLFSASTAGTVRLGIILASSYILLTHAGQIWSNPSQFMIKMAVMNAGFILFGLAINSMKRRIGFNPVYIALLWLPLGWVLVNYAQLSLFGLVEASPNLVASFYSLAGVLLWSMVVVLINSIILALAGFIGRKLKVISRPRYRPGGVLILQTVLVSFPQGRSFFCKPSLRGPPICFSH